MIRVVILGFGNVGQHLYKAFTLSSEIKVVQVYNRSGFSSDYAFAEIFTETTSSLNNLQDADVYIITIPDDAIASFSETLPIHNKLVVHTSGSVAMEALSDTNLKGVFYALQSFSATTDVNFKTIPICVEAENETDLLQLEKLGNLISEKVVRIDSEKRRTLHLAAVYVNNFVNHLYSVSEEILLKNDLDFNLLKPLIKETAEKIELISPTTAQTGPARRNDEQTIQKHLSMLREMCTSANLHKTSIKIYETMTEAIQNKSTEKTS